MRHLDLNHYNQTITSQLSSAPLLQAFGNHFLKLIFIHGYLNTKSKGIHNVWSGRQNLGKQPEKHYKLIPALINKP